MQCEPAHIAHPFLAAAAADSGLPGGSAPQSRRAVAAAGISPPTVNCPGISYEVIGNSCKSTKGNQVGAATTCQCWMLPDVPDGGTAGGHIAEGEAHRTDGKVEKQGSLAHQLRAAHITWREVSPVQPSALKSSEWLLVISCLEHWSLQCFLSCTFFLTRRLW